MKTVLVFLLFGAVAWSSAVAAQGGQSGKQPSCVIGSEEQSVLVAFFKTPAATRELIGDSTGEVMLADKTQPTTNLDMGFVNTQLATKGRAIPVDARQDFSRKSKDECSVGVLPELQRVRIIPTPGEASIPQFHKMYGNQAVLLSVSRVGFSRDGSSAVLHVSYYAHHSGGGCLYVFQRKAGHWSLRTAFPTWTT